MSTAVAPPGAPCRGCGRPYGVLDLTPLGYCQRCANEYEGLVRTPERERDDARAAYVKTVETAQRLSIDLAVQLENPRLAQIDAVRRSIAASQAAQPWWRRLRWRVARWLEA